MKRRAHKGGILPLFLISLLALLGTAALAVDVGHAFLDTTRLQNALDAAALAGAKSFDSTGSATAAATEARNVFNTTAGLAGNQDLAQALGSIQLNITFSQNLVPFSAVASGPFVRVQAQGLGITNWFASAVGWNRFTLGGSAVAGPSPSLDQICDVAPMMACGNPAQAPQSGSNSYYGYTLGSVQMLKISANSPSSLGPGNFQLINLPGNNGGADIRTAMAGSMGSCLATGQNTSLNTAPGNNIGPAAQGINTRFGQYQGPVSPSQYPPDWVTNHSNYTLTDYNNGVQPAFDLNKYLAATAQAALNPPATGVPMRRILRVPIGDCSTQVNGNSQVPLLGVGCFYLIAPVQQQGNQAQIFGQFKGGCGAGGTPGPNPGSGIGAHVIELYHDAGSTSS